MKIRARKADRSFLHFIVAVCEPINDPQTLMPNPKRQTYNVIS